VSLNNVLYPYNDYTTEFRVERAGPDGVYVNATGLVTLRAFIAATPEAATPIHPTLDITLTESSPALYQGTYDGGDLATAFPAVVAGEVVEAWEILKSNLDLRAVRKVKIKPLRVIR
jgi:hypothetical protein